MSLPRCHGNNNEQQQPLVVVVVVVVQFPWKPMGGGGRGGYVVWVCGCARHQKKKKKKKTQIFGNSRLCSTDAIQWDGGVSPFYPVHTGHLCSSFSPACPNLGFLCVQLGVTNKKTRKIPSTRTYDGGWLLLLIQYNLQVTDSLSTNILLLFLFLSWREDFELTNKILHIRRS